MCLTQFHMHCHEGTIIKISVCITLRCSLQFSCFKICNIKYRCVQSWEFIDRSDLYTCLRDRSPRLSKSPYMTLWPAWNVHSFWLVRNCLCERKWHKVSDVFDVWLGSSMLHLLNSKKSSFSFIFGWFIYLFWNLYVICRDIKSLMRFTSDQIIHYLLELHILWCLKSPCLPYDQPDPFLFYLQLFYICHSQRYKISVKNDIRHDSKNCAAPCENGSSDMWTH